MRLALLCPGRLSPFQQRVLDPVLADPAIDVVAAIVDRRPAPPPSARLRRAVRDGRGGFVLVSAASSVRRAPGVDAAAHLRPHGVAIHETADLYADATVDALRTAAPDVVFRSGFGIIREPVLSLAPHGVLSYHHGDLRRYRGLPPAFWELYERAPRMGVTLQVLDAALDAGPVVAERQIALHDVDSWGTLRARAYAASEPLLHEGLHALMRGREPQPVERLGSLYRTPTLRQWASLQLRVAGRRAVRA